MKSVKKKLPSLQEIIDTHKDNLERGQVDTTNQIYGSKDYGPKNIEYMSAYGLLIVHLHHAAKKPDFKERLERLAAALDGRIVEPSKSIKEVKNESKNQVSQPNISEDRDYFDMAYRTLVPAQELEKTRNAQWITRSLATNLYKRVEQLAQVPHLPSSPTVYSGRVYAAARQGRLKMKKIKGTYYVNRETIEEIIHQNIQREEKKVNDTDNHGEGIIRPEHLERAYKMVLSKGQFETLPAAELIPHPRAAEVFKKAEELAGVPHIPPSKNAYSARINYAVERNEIRLTRNSEGRLFVNREDFENMILETGQIRVSEDGSPNANSRYVQLVDLIEKDHLSFTEATNTLGISSKESAVYRRAYYQHQLKNKPSIK